MRFEKVSAHLDLARLLAGSAEGLTLDEMAAEAGVNRRTAERMRDVLRVAFPSLEEISDGRTKRFRIPGGMENFFKAPTPDELAELDIATRALEQQGGIARAGLLRSLAGKIRATLRQHQKHRIEPDLDALVQGESLVMQAGPKPLIDAGLLSTLRDAIKASRVCLFDYRAGNGHSYRRQVAPYGILYGRTYYLVGPESRKPEPVLWRLDRMTNVELGDGFDGPPPKYSLREYAARSFGAFQESAELISLRFRASAAEDARRFDFHPRQALVEHVDGSLIISFEAGGLLELAHHLFTWGNAVEILAPDKLKHLMTDMLKTALFHHENGSLSSH